MFRNQPGCKAFTFVKEWDLNCFLKAAKGDESEFEGAVSGTLEPCSSRLSDGGENNFEEYSNFNYNNFYMLQLEDGSSKP